MGLKDLFRKKEVKELDAPTIETKTPFVVFDSQELEKEVFKWLESKTTATKGLGMVLLELGYDPDETVILNNYDAEKFSFECHSSHTHTNGDTKITLRHGGGPDYYPEIVIGNDGKEKNYECMYSLENGYKLALSWYQLRNQTTGNSYFRYLTPYSSSISLTSGQNIGDCRLGITVNRPDGTYPSSYGFNRFIYRLKNEEQLEKYIAGLTFPIDIVSLYKELRKLSLDPVSEYPSLEIKAEKLMTGKKYQTTDCISLDHGTMRVFTLTRDGRTVSIDSANNRSYQNDPVSISQDANDTVSYSLNDVPKDQIANRRPIIEDVKAADKEIESVRELTKTMFGQNS